MTQREYEDNIERYEIALDNFKEYLREEYHKLKYENEDCDKYDLADIVREVSEDFEGYDFSFDLYDIIDETI